MLTPARHQRCAAQGVPDPVRDLRALLSHKRADSRQIIARVVGDSIFGVVMIALGQTMAAHFRYPHIEALARQESAQADAFRRIPETPIRKTAVQQNNRDAPVFRDIGKAQTGNCQLNGAVGAITGFEAIYIFTQVATTFSADQGDGKRDCCCFA